LDKTLMYSEDKVKWRQLVHGVAKPRNFSSTHIECLIL